MLGIAIFLAVFVVKETVVKSENSCQPFAVKTENLNKRLVGHLLYEIKVPALFPCMNECMFLGTCKSINFIQSEQICELNKISKSADIIEDKGTIFVDKTEFPEGIAGPCSSHTCTDVQRCNPMGSTFVCETLGCHIGWVYFEGSCYFAGQTDLDFVAAERFCTQSEAHLVTVDTANENNFIKSLIKDLQYWIDLTDEIVEGEWRWKSNGALPLFTDWYPGQPNGEKVENCTMITHFWNYQWSDYPCTYKFKPLCEMPWSSGEV